MKKNKRGKSLKYIIIVSATIFILYIAWSILTSGLFCFTHNVKYPTLKAIKKEIGMMLPNGTKILRMTKANISNLYVEVDVPINATDELLSMISNNSRYTVESNGDKYGEFTEWCNYSIENVQYTYVEIDYPGKGMKLKSAIIIMKPENEYRKVYIFNGRLLW